MRKFLSIQMMALSAILVCTSVASASHAIPLSKDFVVRADQGLTGLQTVQYRSNDHDRNDRQERSNNRPATRAQSREAFRDRRYVDRRQGRGYYDRNYGSMRRDDSSAIEAGFLGFVLGAAITGSGNDRTYANSRLNNRRWTRACSRRYRSFDARSGTYLGNDGYRHYCR